MITMAIQNIKAVVLIGDPKQLPPTVISEHENNEGAGHLLRSLMERLHLSGYKSTHLSIDYRSRSHILKLLNKFMYDGELKVGPKHYLEAFASAFRFQE